MKKLSFLVLSLLLPCIASASAEPVKIDTEDGLSTYTQGISQIVDDALQGKKLRVGFHRVPFLGSIVRLKEEHGHEEKPKDTLVYQLSDGQKLYRFDALAGLQKIESAFNIPKCKTPKKKDPKPPACLRIQGKPKGWAIRLGQHPHRYIEYPAGPTEYVVQITDQSDADKKYLFLQKLLAHSPVFVKLFIKGPKQESFISLKDFLQKHSGLEIGNYIFSLEEAEN